MCQEAVKLVFLPLPARLLAGCRQQARHLACKPVAVWSRPQQDRDNDFVKPSYIPTPYQAPVNPGREGAPLYAPSMPEFSPGERPDQSPELPAGPKMPERRPDPIPASRPKEKPPGGAPERREAPAPKESEAPKP